MKSTLPAYKGGFRPSFTYPIGESRIGLPWSIAKPVSLELHRADKGKRRVPSLSVVPEQPVDDFVPGLAPARAVAGNECRQATAKSFDVDRQADLSSSRKSLEASEVET